ncbi:MAG: DEAD/DEAH box helicase [Mycoplasmataceae bacterium]|nr:DEAD/DEAH box helicase [Mycoplasmataceae bacterium]
MSNSFLTYLVYTGETFFVDKKPLDPSKAAIINKSFQASLFDDLTNDPIRTIFDASFESDWTQYDVSIVFLLEVVKEFVNLLTKSADVELTKKVPSVEDAFLFDLSKKAPFTYGCEFVNIFWLKTLWKQISDYFELAISKYDGTVNDFFHSKNPKLNLPSRVYFHLVEYKDDPEYEFAFLATYATIIGKDKIHQVPINQALNELKKREDLVKLLSSIIDASEKSKMIKDLLDSGELFSTLKLTRDEAYTFLKEIEIYEGCGIVCRIPNFWKKKQTFLVKISVGEKATSQVGLESLIDFSPHIYLDDEQLTKEEVEELSSQEEGLSLIKGKWVEVDHQKLNVLLKSFENINNKKDLTLLETLKLGNTLVANETNGMQAIEVNNGQWLSLLIEKMQNPKLLDSNNLNLPTFHGELRPYQQEGLNWLSLIIQNQLGCILADDMGLGKTIQILALLSLRLNTKHKTLLIVPASLLANWEREIKKFVPELRFKILHGSDKSFKIADYDLLITTYATSLKIASLLSYHFDLIILDEAQCIKNAVTKNTKYIKQLKCRSRIALTGTPIENNLVELWSIFDFINPGLLGTLKEFNNFVKGLKNNPNGYERLRKIISPFILRRLKIDKKIITDLPNKNEIKQYVGMTKKQVVLYQDIVSRLAETLEHTDMFHRRMLVLTSIMKLKQICNHPDQFLGNHQYNELHSEKFLTLIQLCQIIKERHERVVVFTQFKELTRPIAELLEKVFEQKGLVLHGSIPVSQRGKLVKEFNDVHYTPFMVLSLKAGGVGLNLVGANNVIHFDRWWNPAVENQATDRTYRIGQRKDVMVYKFITTGTIEEKIDNIISQKMKLANDIIGKNEESTWITKMNNDEILSLFKLGG